MEAISKASKEKLALITELAHERLQLVRRQTDEKVREAGGGETEGVRAGTATGHVDIMQAVEAIQSVGLVFPPELLASMQAFVSQQALRTPVPVDPPAAGVLVQVAPNAAANNAPAAGAAGSAAPPTRATSSNESIAAEAAAAAAKVLAGAQDQRDGDLEMGVEGEEEDDPDAPGQKRQKLRPKAT